jgi:hypothetical protein
LRALRDEEYLLAAEADVSPELTRPTILGFCLAVDKGLHEMLKLYDPIHLIRLKACEV